MTTRLPIERINALAKQVGISYWPVGLAPKVTKLIRAIEEELAKTARTTDTPQPQRQPDDHHP